MIFEPYRLPDYANPDYTRGFEDGYLACKEDVNRAIKVLNPLVTETSTVSTGGPNDE